METPLLHPTRKHLISLYSLEKLIEWKPSSMSKGMYATVISLYSLEKLIEWKPNQSGTYCSQDVTLYSLEKLIEWKQSYLVLFSHVLISLYSLEKLIEWKHRSHDCYLCLFCLPLYSLEKLIEWKRQPSFFRFSRSLFLSTR